MKRKPAFTLTPAQVVQLCVQRERRLICAGQVLALKELMRETGWTIAEVARRSRVSRAMISEFLRFQAFPTSELMSRLAEAFKLELYEFNLLAKYAVEAEVSL